MADIKYCVSTYSFNKLIKKGEMTQFDTIRKAKEMGFDGIEFVELNARDGEDIKAYAQRLKEEADKVGIEIANFCMGADFINGRNVPKSEELDRVKGIIDAAALLGVKTMRHDVIGKLGEYLTFDTALPELSEKVREISKYAEEKGIMTMVENHGYLCQDALRVEKLLSKVNYKNFGLLLDMGNFLCAGEDPALCASLIAPYAKMVHAKDFHIKSGEGFDPGERFIKTRDGSFIKGAVFGQGNVPVVQILRALKKAEYKGWISLEYEGWDDVFDGIRIGFSNLKKYVEAIFCE
ncbi:MAG: sugar phosphate isomerase/epimerase [Ruminococcaceae bacterium]|nr:sugar phosphate isomerase/epimerase [Oscillospiraceae bacterium]